jgi:hypothetical protein
MHCLTILGVGSFLFKHIEYRNKYEERALITKYAIPFSLRLFQAFFLTPINIPEMNSGLIYCCATSTKTGMDRNFFRNS